jgi:hypothetical protein
MIVAESGVAAGARHQEDGEAVSEFPDSTRTDTEAPPSAKKRVALRVFWLATALSFLPLGGMAFILSIAQTSHVPPNGDLLPWPVKVFVFAVAAGMSGGIGAVSAAVASFVQQRKIRQKPR